MPLIDDLLKHFANAEPAAKRVVGNVVAGIRLGLHTEDELLRFLQSIAPGVPVAGLPTDDTLAALFSNGRVAGSDPDSRPRILDGDLPLARLNTASSPTVAQFAYRVTPVRALDRLLPASQRLSTSGALASPGVPPPAANLDKMLSEAYARLKPMERRFNFTHQTGIGNPTVWFTSAGAIQALDARFKKSGRRRKRWSWADAHVAALGLAHFDKGSWLARLQIPVEALDRAGHFRPCAADGAKGSDWFAVAPCRDLARIDDDWGRAVDLDELAKRAAHDLRGGEERMSRRLLPKDFAPSVAGGDPLVIRFEILGEVQRNWEQLSSKERLHNHVFADQQRP